MCPADGDSPAGGKPTDVLRIALEKGERDYTATIARVAGNLMSGTPGAWLGVTPDFRLATIQDAVETARLIVEEVRRRSGHAGSK